ncbi:G protein-regulated inducer of neurite outgrowth 3 [Spea bombifrons]|uniref:G protein-regulated inducer of neurite outgrowth 3 n=1 Tax=Spea bombifrons TaxID=233779 RepID=UPI00234B29A7|nr:G protein-regulated inducer of neurite outgrowth 3 [Spea bombifrons]XP_053317571.1 G protein-regulated inducer of neurite outgrowth 3 [Spea bombifrons]
MGTVPDPQGSVKSSVTTTLVAEDCPESDTPHVAKHHLHQTTSKKNGDAVPVSDICPADLTSRPTLKTSDHENICSHKIKDTSRESFSFRTSNQPEVLPQPDEQHFATIVPEAIKDTTQHVPTTSIIPSHSEISVSTSVVNLTCKELMVDEGGMAKNTVMVEQVVPDQVSFEVGSSPTAKNMLESSTDMDLNKETMMHLPSQEVDHQRIDEGANKDTNVLDSSTSVLQEGKGEDQAVLPKPEECLQLTPEEAELNKNGEPLLLESELLCKFKDMGTMTSQMHSWAKQDAEVQAVANVVDKSVSTSPSILSAFLKVNSPMFKERQEQVCIIYQGNPGNAPKDRANFALHPQMSQNHLAPKVRFQPPDAMSPQPLQLHNKSPPDMVRSPFQHTDLARNPQVLYRNELDGQNRGMPQMPMASASPLLMNVKPVYQINIENSQKQSKMYNDPSQFRTPHDISNKARLHHLSGIENIQLHNVRQDNEQTETLMIPGDGSSDRKPFHFKITNEQGSTQAIITTDIKTPKKEEKMSPLRVEVEVNNSGGATGGPVDEILEVLVRKEQDENDHAKKSSSLSLHSKPAPDLNQGAMPLTPRLRKAREEKNEPILLTLPTSEQSKLLGKKAAQTGSSPEAKTQAKQPAKSVKDVVWDEQGMTWEVYGASMDPEALGIAIQNHLQRQIREHEKMIRSQLKQNRKSISDASGKKHKRRQHRVFQSMLKNFRRPNCCVRPPPSAVLE